MNSVAGDCRKDLLRDCENVPPGFIREAVIEHSGFPRSGDVALNNDGCIDRLEIFQCVAHHSNESDAVATLTDVWFQNERQRDLVLTTQSVQIKQALASCLSLYEDCVSGESRRAATKLGKNLQLRFSDETASRDSRICRSRYAQTAVTNC